MFYKFHENGSRSYVPLEGLYQNGTCFLIGGSPKLLQEDLTLFQQRGVVTVAMNNSAETVKPNLWIGGDNPACYSKRLIKDPSILKLARFNRGHIPVEGLPWKFYPNTLFYWLRNENYFTERNFLKPDKGIVWWSNTWWIALQLLWRLGFRTVFLCGCGFTISKEEQYSWKTNLDNDEIARNTRLYNKTVDRMNRMQTLFDDNGYNIVNCTQDSPLEDTYGYMELPVAIEMVTKTIPAFDPTKIVHSSKVAKVTKVD